MPTAALQAAVIIGSGSASFEMLRYLTERLPAMVTPKWVETRIQPIAVRDVLRYLVGAAALPPGVSRRFDIGGPDVLTYAEMMRRYAAVAGLRPRDPGSGAAAHAAAFLAVGRAGDAGARPAWPSRWSSRCGTRWSAPSTTSPGTSRTRRSGLLSLDRAIALALRHTREGDVSTRWSSAGYARRAQRPAAERPVVGRRLALRGRAHRRRPRRARGAVAESSRASAVTTGWYSFPAAWAVRGLLDRLVGGVGLRRGTA